MKTTTWSLQVHRTIQKLVTVKITGNRDTLQKVVFPKNPTAHALLSKVPKKHHHFGATLFFQSNHLKGNGPSA